MTLSSGAPDTKGSSPWIHRHWRVSKKYTSRWPSEDSPYAVSKASQVASSSMLLTACLAGQMEVGRLNSSALFLAG